MKAGRVVGSQEQQAGTAIVTIDRAVTFLDSPWRPRQHDTLRISYNGDGKSDLLWRDAAGDTYIWFMNGTAIASVGYVATIPSPWAVQSLNAE
jgi:hypothetical protein